MTQTYAPGSPIWVDLGTNDIAGAVAFYGAIFGWTHQDFGPEMGGYGALLKDGKRIGGIGPLMNPDGSPDWQTYFATDDADETAARVTKAGGRVVTGPMDVMEAGRMAVFADPAGDTFAAWQPGRNKGAELIYQPGAVAWNEVVTSDAQAAKAFYRDVLDVATREVDMGPGMTYTLLQADGKAVAGLMASAPEMGDVPTGWTVYFEVEDADAAYAKATGLGAATRIPPTDIAPGRFAIIDDPHGASFGIIQSNPDFTP